MNDPWPLVHAERAALIDDLTGLGDQRWHQQSLCGKWTIHDVLAHLVDNARTTRTGFLIDLARSRFDFDRYSDRGVRRSRCATPGDTLAQFRRVAQRRCTPPAPIDSRLVEEIVHGEDIRRPLGITRGYPVDSVVRALRSQARTPASFGGAKELLAQVRVTAEDAEVSIGDGPQVHGTALALLRALSGRTIALADLRGPGLAALERLTRAATS